MKQEKFCQNIINGMTNIDSYMNAYNSKSRHAANIESTKLLARDDVSARLKELNKPIVELVQSQSINARQQQIEYTLERRKLCAEKGDEASVIRYNEQLNKLWGLYNEQPQAERQENPLEELDTETLKKLVGTA